MRGVYHATVALSNGGANKSLVLLQIPATIALEILGLELVDYTNIAIEQLAFALDEITSFGSAAGSSTQIMKTEYGDQAAAMAGANAVITQVTTEPTTYAAQELRIIRMSTHEGKLIWTPLPEERPVLAPGKKFGIKNFPALSFTPVIVGHLAFREIG